MQAVQGGTLFEVEIELANSLSQISEHIKTASCPDGCQKSVWDKDIIRYIT